MTIAYALRSTAAFCAAAAFSTLAFAQTTPFASTQFLTGSTASGEVLNTTGTLSLGGGTPYTFNTIDDTTGAKLTADNGDRPDFTLIGQSTAGANGTTAITLNPSSAAARVQDTHSFAGPAASNNAGSVNANTTTLLFSPHLRVTDATFNFSSLNTAGVSWEYSVIQFLDVNGNPFSALSGPSWNVGSTGQYGTAGNGFTGAAGVGNFVAASTATVTGVGTSATASGVSGSSDNLRSFNYDLVGLAAGTQIGGIRWTTFLEDVRGVNNGNTNFSSSLLDFSIAGTVAAVPEPSTYALFAAGLAVIGFCRARRKG